MSQVSKRNAIKLGFIGTGAITEAVVSGLCHPDLPTCVITVSPRGAYQARRLADTFPNVTIGATNQQVIDRSDIVFLALRPQVAEKAIRELVFKAEQSIVSFIATVSTEDIQTWIPRPVKITQAVPLPFVGARLGATVVFPPEPDIAALFNRLGTAVEVNNVSELELLLTVSALMGTYFGLLEQASKWLCSRGIQGNDADAYLRQLHVGLANSLTTRNLDFAALRNEFSTKGGLNEQLFDVFSRQGGLAALENGLDAVLNRVRKGTSAATTSLNKTPRS